MKKWILWRRDSVLFPPLLKMHYIKKNYICWGRIGFVFYELQMVVKKDGKTFKILKTIFTNILWNLVLRMLWSCIKQFYCFARIIIGTARLSTKFYLFRYFAGSFVSGLHLFYWATMHNFALCPLKCKWDDISCILF